MARVEGVALVREVIRKLRSDGFVSVFGESMVDEEVVPRPVSRAALESLAFDGGRLLSPCLLEWLAFDGSFFDWFDDPAHPVFRREKIGAVARQWLEPGRGSVFGALERTVLPRDCYWVPFGDETMRFVYPSEPDQVAELPVMLLDVDDQPLVTVGYPGIDVYLGYHAGLLGDDWADSFEDRMAFHREGVLGGRDEIELGDDDFPAPDAAELHAMMDADTAEFKDLPAGMSPMGGGLFMLTGNAPLPGGFVVKQEMGNPFTGERMRVVSREGPSGGSAPEPPRRRGRWGNS